MEANGKTYAPVPGKIPGTALNLGGHDFIIAPLNLDGVQAAMPLLDSLRALKALPDIIKESAKIVHLSMIRNNPDITLDEVTALLDAGNVANAVSIVCGVSGMEIAKPGESRPSSP